MVGEKAMKVRALQHSANDLFIPASAGFIPCETYLAPARTPGNFTEIPEVASFPSHRQYRVQVRTVAGDLAHDIRFEPVRDGDHIACVTQLDLREHEFTIREGVYLP